MPRDIERRILVYHVSADRRDMKSISRPEGGGAILPISETPTLGAYQDDWKAVSHTFELLPDGSGLFSILLERPAEGPVEE